MAIILPPPQESSLEAVVQGVGRPAWLVREGTIDPILSGSPFQGGELQRHILECAIRGVGRVETERLPYEYVGTAFLIDSTRAVTAGLVAEALLLQRPDGGSETGRKPLEDVWLNFRAEAGSAAVERIAIVDVQLVHPYWGFAFLILGEAVRPERVLEISEKPSEAELDGLDICVIGYPGFDQRDESEAMKRIFSDTFDVKRVMPGRIMGQERRGSESSLNLLHDASTTGGTSGAPLVDLRTGKVVGLHLGGQSRHSNFAAPAWEIRRDPQWWSRSDLQSAKPRSAVEVAREVIDAQETSRIFDFDEVQALYGQLIKVGIKSEAGIGMLLVGLPSEYLAALPQQGESAAERLLAILHGINETGGRIRNHSAFYFVLSTAKTKRSWDVDWVKKMDGWLALVLQREGSAT